jgi:hypothetical protein
VTISISDISFVLSGGVNNISPALSLGGYPSPIPISDTIPNLFSNVDAAQASSGISSYRCFYIFNDHPTDPMYEVTLSSRSLSTTNTPTTMLIGVLLRNEIQTVTLSPTIVGSVSPDAGGFRLIIDSIQTDMISYDSDNDVLAESMDAALKSILEGDVSVTFSGLSGTDKTFAVTFYGINRNKAFGTLDIDDNTMVPAHTFVADKSIVGSPINNVANDIEQETFAPTGVSFAAMSTLSIGKLDSSSGFPVWLKRTIPPLAEFQDADGEFLKISAKTSPGI